MTARLHHRSDCDLKSMAKDGGGRWTHYFAIIRAQASPQHWAVDRPPATASNAFFKDPTAPCSVSLPIYAEVAAKGDGCAPAFWTAEG